MNEDMSIFFDGLDSVLAEFVTGNSSWYVQGYFDNGFYDTSVGDVVLDTTQPRFTCDSYKISKIQRGSSVIIKSKEYKIIQIQPDGTGTSVVLLSHE